MLGTSMTGLCAAHWIVLPLPYQLLNLRAPQGLILNRSLSLIAASPDSSVAHPLISDIPYLWWLYTPGVSLRPSQEVALVRINKIND